MFTKDSVFVSLISLVESTSYPHATCHVNKFCNLIWVIFDSMPFIHLPQFLSCEFIIESTEVCINGNNILMYIAWFDISVVNSHFSVSLKVIIVFSYQYFFRCTNNLLIENVACIFSFDISDLFSKRNLSIFEFE